MMTPMILVLKTMMTQIMIMTALIKMTMPMMMTMMMTMKMLRPMTIIHFLPAVRRQVEGEDDKMMMMMMMMTMTNGDVMVIMMVIMMVTMMTMKGWSLEEDAVTQRWMWFRLWLRHKDNDEHLDQDYYDDYDNFLVL